MLSNLVNSKIKNSISFVCLLYMFSILFYPSFSFHHVLKIMFMYLCISYILLHSSVHSLRMSHSDTPVLSFSLTSYITHFSCYVLQLYLLMFINYHTIHICPWFMRCRRLLYILSAVTAWSHSVCTIIMSYAAATDIAIFSSLTNWQREVNDIWDFGYVYFGRTRITKQHFKGQK